MCVCVCQCTMYIRVCGEVKGQLVAISSVLLPRASYGLHLGCEA